MGGDVSGTDLNLPLHVFDPIKDISEKRRSHDAEREEEAHGEAEEQGRGHQERQHHGVAVDRAALLLKFAWNETV